MHHTATGNNYTCAQAPSVIRGIYRYHVKSRGWRDIGYNFLVDKCGKIYEGRAGGVAKPVLGAHTLGFNTNSMGIAVLGATAPPNRPGRGRRRRPSDRLEARLYGVESEGQDDLTSGRRQLYRKGKNVRLNVISGHRDGSPRNAPAGNLYASSARPAPRRPRYQGR